jgi:hypothetical protein
LCSISLVALTLTGCGDDFHVPSQLWARNDSDQQFLTREVIEGTSRYVFVWRLDPHTAGVFNELDTRGATVDVLDPSCRVLATWTGSDYKVGVTITDTGAISFLAGPADTTALGLYPYEAGTTECGGQRPVPPPATIR